MATQKVNAHVASIVEEVAVSTIDDFKSFISKSVDVDDDLNLLFEDFKKQLITKTKTLSKEKVVKEKVKREPSPYNLYIQKKMRELKEAGHTGNLMKMAIEEYNKEKRGAVSSEEVSDE